MGRAIRERRKKNAPYMVFMFSYMWFGVLLLVTTMCVFFYYHVCVFV